MKNKITNFVKFVKNKIINFIKGVKVFTKVWWITFQALAIFYFVYSAVSYISGTQIAFIKSSDVVLKSPIKTVQAK